MCTERQTRTSQLGLRLQRCLRALELMYCTYEGVIALNSLPQVQVSQHVQIHLACPKTGKKQKLN